MSNTQDVDLRLSALHHAVSLYKDAEAMTDDDVVRVAETFYKFLAGSPGPWPPAP